MVFSPVPNKCFPCSFETSCAFSFCWFVVTLHQALNLWFLDEPYQGNWSAYPNLLSQTCEQDVVIDCIKSGAEIKYDQQSHLLTVHFHKNIIRDFDKSRFRTIILTIWWLKLGIFNNYSLKSRWIVAKYSQSHYPKRLKRITVLVYTHEAISTKSERKTLKKYDLIDRSNHA